MLYNKQVVYDSQGNEHPMKSVDACLNDSGGPLVCRRHGNHDRPSNQYVLWGVTSHGKKCGLRESPGIYTKVVSFYNWMYANIVLKDEEFVGGRQCDYR